MMPLQNHHDLGVEFPPRRFLLAIKFAANQFGGRLMILHLYIMTLSKYWFDIMMTYDDICAVNKQAILQKKHQLEVWRPKTNQGGNVRTFHPL